MRYSTNVIPRQLFDIDQQDAFEIVKRQGELDIWYKSNYQQDQIRKAIKMRDPKQIGQVVSDNIQNFRGSFESKLKQNEDKISKQFDEITILNNKLNQALQRIQMFDKTSVSKDHLKIYSTGQAAVFSKMEETIDNKYKQMQENLKNATIEWSVDKNKQIADLSELLTKCEEGLKL